MPVGLMFLLLLVLVAPEKAQSPREMTPQEKAVYTEVLRGARRGDLGRFGLRGRTELLRFTSVAPKDPYVKVKPNRPPGFMDALVAWRRRSSEVMDLTPLAGDSVEVVAGFTKAHRCISSLSPPGIDVVNDRAVVMVRIGCRKEDSSFSSLFLVFLESVDNEWKIVDYQLVDVGGR